jgi:hypothetical protein
MESVILKKIKENPSAKIPRQSGEQDVFLYTKTVLPSTPFGRTGFMFRGGTCSTLQLNIL